MHFNAAYYEVAAFSPNGTAMTEWLNADQSYTEFAFSVDGPPLAHGLTYTLAVRGRNFADLWSLNATTVNVTVDLTAPVLFNATVNASNYTMRVDLSSVEPPLGNSSTGPRYAIVQVLNANDPNLRMSWNFSEDVSSLGECLISIGTFPGGEDVTKFFSIGRQTSCVVPLSFLGTTEPAVVYFPSITCDNTAGLRSTISGPPVLIDLVPPVIGPVIDGLFPVEVPYLTEPSPDIAPTDLSASWPFADDANTEIINCQVAAGTNASGLTSVSGGWIDVGNARSATLTNLVIPAGVPIQIAVRCTDSPGNIAMAVSKGAVFDDSPPVVPSVVDGANPDQESSFWSLASTFSCQFPGVNDPDSGIGSIFAGLATTSVLAAAGTPDLVPLVSTGLEPWARFTGLKLSQVGCKLMSSVHH